MGQRAAVGREWRVFGGDWIVGHFSDDFTQLESCATDTPYPVFFVSADSTGVTGANRVTADSNGVKSVCFHTVSWFLVSAISSVV